MIKHSLRRAPRTGAALGTVAVAVVLLAGVPSAGGSPASPASSPQPAVAAVPSASGVGVVDPDQGLWYLRNPDGTLASFFFGNPGDFPLMGDWDCDGIDTPGMYRQSDGFVYLHNRNAAGVADTRFFFGDPGDIPIAGDFDGDGCDTVSIYRPAEGRAFVINQLGQAEGGLGTADFAYYFGNPGDKPFVGDFDGDGIDTLGLHRESTGLVYFRQSHTAGIADSQFIYGDPGDRLTAGDWNGNGADSPVLFRPADTNLYFRFTNTQGVADDVLGMGLAAFIPVAGHFGALPTQVAVTLAGGPLALERAVAGLYLMRSAAPGIPPGLRTHLDLLDRGPRTAALTGTAVTSTLLGQAVAVVSIGSDLLLAVESADRWDLVGARLATLGAASWYGNVPRLVLVVGTDTAPGQDPLRKNSDSVHILSAVPATGQGAIVGIPRDTFVQAPYGRDKLAITSRDKGTGEPFGPATTLATVRDLTRLPVEGYITTGFVGFTGLVDAFGGFSANLVYPVDFAGVVLPAGPNLLDGRTALATARERMTYPSGDVDRQLNHGLLIKAALVEIQSQGIPTLLANLSLLDRFVITDLDAADLLSLGAAALELDDVANVVVEGDVVFEMLRGEVSFGFGLTAANLTTFADLADGVISPGQCAVTMDAGSPLPACWRRP